MIPWAIIISLFCATVVFTSVIGTRRKIRRKDTELTFHAHRFETGQKRLRAIIRAIPDFFFIADGNGNYLEYNPSEFSHLKAPDYNLIGKNIADIHCSEDAERLMAAISAVLAHGGLEQVEYTLDIPAGRRQYECRIVSIDAESVLCLSRDITKRLEHEKALERSLHEKEALLSEIHHRVKNNLQIISSLINLQGEHFVSEHDRTLMEDTESRIRSMSRLHELLYQSDTFISIDLKAYLSGIIDELIFSSHQYSSSIQVQKTIEPLRVNLDCAMPIGLIVNELVLNELKFLHREGKTGTLRVVLRTQEGMVYVEVSHACPGSDAGTHKVFEESEKFGYVLVPALTNQLEGNLSLRPEPGIDIRLSFDRNVLCGPGRLTNRDGVVDNRG